MKSLLQTIQEVIPDEQEAMVLHSLIMARFFVVEKDRKAGDLPVMVEVKLGKTRYAFGVGNMHEITLTGPTGDYGQELSVIPRERRYFWVVEIFVWPRIRRRYS